MLDVLYIKGLLDEDACAAARRELRGVRGCAASLLGEAQSRPLVRRASQLMPSPVLSTQIVSLFTAIRPQLEDHFSVALAGCEPPQFLRYASGDFFVAHQDGNTPLIRDDSRFRKVSVVLFLSAASHQPTPETYGGGELVLHGPYGGPMLREPVNGAPGTLVAFRSETTHEVTPITHGERFTVVTWYR